MREAVIVSTARTAIGKAFRGSFNITHGATMGGAAAAVATARSGVDPDMIEDCIMGAVFLKELQGPTLPARLRYGRDCR